MQSESLNILISPLDWGLGHASRCIPVIYELINAGHRVTIAGSGRSLILLKKEFPSLQCIELKGFTPNVAFKKSFVIQLARIIPKFLFSIISEHYKLKEILKKEHFDVVISDNRYGLWNPKITSVFITHQVMIKAQKRIKLTEYLLYLISRMIISKFDACWIPDYNKLPGLSGDLSHKYLIPSNSRFIGPLSRFMKMQNSMATDPGKYKIVAIVSGPEPQRSQLEEILTKQLIDYELPSLLIKGKPEEGISMFTVNNLSTCSHMDTSELLSAIKAASLIISRSGYTSVMDFNELGTKVLFVPTPGQTEQQYLAELHKTTGTALWREQDYLNLSVDIEEAIKFRGFSCNTSETEFKAAIAGLKKK